MSLASGTALGPYEILVFIGAGGMGEVYRARDTRLERDVAIKVLPPNLAVDPGSLARFEREARTLSRLAHPNVCTVYDVGVAGETRYLVMELVEGQTLSHLLAAGPLPADRALDYAIQMADGLAKAHGLGIIHRDLKPSNVMVTRDGFVKLLDFGLAKRFGAAENEATAMLTITDSAMAGTVAYMAPEQTMGARPDVRTDIFSFGVVLYEMFTGLRPFDGGNVISTIRRINDVNPQRLRMIRSDISPAVEQIVEGTLRKDPRDRYQSVDELRAALRVAAGRSTSASSVAMAVEAARARRGWRPRAALATGIGTMALAAILVWQWGSREEEPAATTASAAAPSVADSRPSDATGWARRGQQLMTRYDRPQNVELAIEAFRHAVELEPGNALGHAGLAEAFYRKDALTPDPQWKRLASEHARRAVDLNPDIAVAHLAQAMVFLSTGEHTKADEALRRAQDLDPRSADVLRWRGDYFMAVDKAKAEATYAEAVRLAPHDWRTHLWLGRFYFNEARYPEAAREWERAAELSSDNVLVLRNLGGVYHSMDRADDAAVALQRALEIEPAATTYNNLATMRFFQGRYGDAAAAFEKAVELNPTYFLYWGNLGDAYRWIPGQENKAREAFTRAIALTEDRLESRATDVSLRASLAGYFAKVGQAEKALAQVGIIEAVSSRAPVVYFKTALVYEITGNRTAALRDLEAAIVGGYSLREIANEAEFAKLRSDTRYHRMLARLQK